MGTLGALLCLVVIPINPVNNRLLKLALLGCLFGAWLGVTILVWKQKPWRSLALLLPLFAGIPFLLPGGEIDSEELREDYVQRMTEFEGTRYYWGGESPRGIDCSGLPRRALRDALLGYGLRHGNGRAFRGYLEQWWFDASAKALSEGYRDDTRPLETEGIIRDMDYGELLPGDFAVTRNGVHLIAYAGDGKWIQADPGLEIVLTEEGRKGENGWFHTPVSTHRWRVLEPGEHDR